MGKILERIKTNMKENRELHKEQRIANKEMHNAALIEAREAYKQEYIKGAREAVKSRAKREAINRFGYTKSERRQRALGNLTKELGGLGNWAVGNEQRKSTGKKSSVHKTITKKKKKKKQSDPFDLGNINDFDIGNIF